MNSTGVQIGAMAAITLAAATIGLTTDYYRGVMLSTVLAVYVLLSSLGAYTSARLYRMMLGARPLANFLLTWGLLPSVTAATFLVSDAALATVGSSGAVGAQVVATAAAVWLGTSLLLSAAGYYAGHRAAPAAAPVRTNLIPRVEPNWSEGRSAPVRIFDAARRSTAASALFVGALSFGLVLWPFFYVFASWWYVLARSPHAPKGALGTRAHAPENE